MDSDAAHAMIGEKKWQMRKRMQRMSAKLQMRLVQQGQNVLLCSDGLLRAEWGAAGRSNDVMLMVAVH